MEIDIEKYNIEELAERMDYLQLEKLIKAYVKSGYSEYNAYPEMGHRFDDYKDMFVSNIRDIMYDLEEN